MSLSKPESVVVTKMPTAKVSLCMIVRIFSANGGLERYTHRLVEGLFANSYKVTVLCEAHESELTDKDLTVVKLKPRPKALKKRDLLQYYYREFTKLLEENGPFDLVHSQQVAMDNVDVAHFHNHTVHRMNKVGKAWERWLNALKLRIVPYYKERDKHDRLLAFQAKVLIFPSSVCKKDFEETYQLLLRRDPASHLVAYPGADQIETIQDPVSSSSLSIPYLDSAPVNFLFVGKGFRKKGLDTLLSACRILRNDRIPFRLVIAGLKEKLIDRARLIKLGLTKHVVYLGFQSDMTSVYRNAKVIVLPSRMEPFGMAPLEGMQHGLVPIVSRISGVSEILSDGKDGLILEDHLSGEELAKLMARLIKNRDETIALSKLARLTSSSATWEQTLNGTLAGYAQILAGRTAKNK